jgi:DNA-binding NtrC family response regulator
MTRSRKSRPPSLYKTVVERPEADMTSIHDVFKVLNAGSPPETLKGNLALCEGAAAAAERGGLTGHAARLRKHLQWLQRFRRDGKTDAAIVEAMALAAAYERLRADKAFAGAIDSYRRSHRPAVTDDQIRAEMKRTKGRQNLAAARLGISERQLSTRVARLGLRRNRKSTTSAEE